MYGRVEQFISLFYDAVRFAVFLNWGAFSDRVDDIRGWWNGMIDDINNAIDASYRSIVNWVQPWIDWIDEWTGWAGEEFQALWNKAQAVFDDSTQYAWEIVTGVYAWTAEWINKLLAEAARLDNYVLDFVNDIYWPWITTAYENITTLWSYVFGDLLNWDQWLQSVKGVVNWLVESGWSGLQQFLADPWGFIFGLYRQLLIDILEFFELDGTPLVIFVREIMADVYEFWSIYRANLWEFFTDPAGWILDRIKEPFIDWAAGLIEERW